MKKMLKKSMFAFVFVLAFLLCGTLAVSAKETKTGGDVLNNTKVDEEKSQLAKVQVEEEDYYVGNGSSQEGSIVVSAINKGKYEVGFNPGLKVYYAKVAIVKCDNLVSDICTSWVKYEVTTSDDKTMDALRASTTLKFDSLKAAENLGTINGQNVNELTSAFGLDKTYFVIVQYTAQNVGGGLFGFGRYNQAYNPDVIKVVFTDDFSPIEVSATKASGKATITVKSVFPIDSTKSFHVTTQLANTYDFDASYEDSGNGVETTIKDPIERVDGVYTYTYEIDVQEGEFYYIQIKDKAGRTATYDLDRAVQNSGSSTVDTAGNGSGNVGNTKVGKIILLALLVVLVLSLVLVIVQRIVDYRKKLY